MSRRNLVAVGTSLWERVAATPDVVRTELEEWLRTAPAEEVAATRDQLIQYAELYAKRGNVEVLRLARLTEWEMAHRWPSKAGGGARCDDRPTLHASNVADRVAWQRIYEVGRANRERIVAETEASALSQARVRQWAKIQDIVDLTPAKPVFDTDARFGVIYADPPWNYSNKAERGKPENHYPVMDLQDICALDVPVADDCVLYLWATAPLLPEALEVITSWGFRYKTCAVWDKERIGVGYWYRGQHELLLVGVRGKVVPPPQSLRVSSVYREPRTAHSRKPEIVRTHIGAWFPDVPKLEMFARQAAPGWHVWGNQVDSSLAGLPVSAWSPKAHEPDLFEEVSDDIPA